MRFALCYLLRPDAVGHAVLAVLLAAVPAFADGPKVELDPNDPVQRAETTARTLQERLEGWKKGQIYGNDVFRSLAIKDLGPSAAVSLPLLHEMLVRDERVEARAAIEKIGVVRESVPGILAQLRAALYRSRDVYFRNDELMRTIALVGSLWESWRAPEAVEALKVGLTGNHAVRDATLRQLARMGEGARPALKELADCSLGDSSALARYAIECAAPRPAEARTVGLALAERLPQCPPEVRARAASTLGILGRACGDRTIVEALITASEDADPAVRARVVGALAEIGPAARPAERTLVRMGYGGLAPQDAIDRALAAIRAETPKTQLPRQGNE